MVEVNDNSSRYSSFFIYSYLLGYLKDSNEATVHILLILTLVNCRK